MTTMDNPTLVRSRLFAATAADLAEHDHRTGPLPWQGGVGRLIGELQTAGLTGRGGAGFPTWRKVAEVATGVRPVVIANAAETEPGSRKDDTLLRRCPHLVLDGLQLLAEAVGAAEAYLYVQPGAGMAAATQALAERGGRDRLAVRVVAAPDRFVAGEESAVIAAIAGRPAVPTDKWRLVVRSGLHGRATLVQNVETLAHVAQIARHGARWFRGLGTRDEPGTMLVTVDGVDGGAPPSVAPATPAAWSVPPPGAPVAAGRVLGPREPGTMPATPNGLMPPPAAPAAAGVVREVPIGIPLTELVTGPVLVGGYHGTWLRTPAARLSRASLTPLGASPGAGVLHVLPPDRCALVETAAIARYLAGQSARQCGPCRNGLPATATLLGALADRTAPPDAPQRLAYLTGLVTGRGACHHPDGTARLIRSALTVFDDEVRLHLAGRCSR